jgi:hypothetical protein
MLWKVGRIYILDSLLDIRLASVLMNAVPFSSFLRHIELCYYHGTDYIANSALIVKWTLLVHIREFKSEVISLDENTVLISSIFCKCFAKLCDVKLIFFYRFQDGVL